MNRYLQTIGIVILLSLASQSFAVNADATATNTTNATSGSTALSGSSSGVQSNINAGSAGVGVGTATGAVTNIPTNSIDSHGINYAPDLSKAVGIAAAPSLTTTLTETSTS